MILLPRHRLLPNHLTTHHLFILPETLMIVIPSVRSSIDTFKTPQIHLSDKRSIFRLLREILWQYPLGESLSIVHLPRTAVHCPTDKFTMFSLFENHVQLERKCAVVEWHCCRSLRSCFARISFCINILLPSWCRRAPATTTFPFVALLVTTTTRIVLRHDLPHHGFRRSTCGTTR